jgi:subtilisin family serine protease
MPTLLIILHIFFVSFIDKPEKTAPALSPRAVEQREKWNIPTDDMDYPVSPMYLSRVRKAGARVHHVSRWFNGATVEMSDETAAEVAKLSCVTAVEKTRIGSDMPFSPRRIVKRTDEPLLYVTDPQQDLYNLRPLHEAGYEGKGILMAVCDGGFSAADTLSCFRQKELQLGYFDFTDDIDGFFEKGGFGNHGTACLSAISGIQEGYYGAATKAQYYLMRSEEYVTESPKEMDNLVAALEKADSLGVNIFSVSLGYFRFNNPEWDIDKQKLDGKTYRASRAAHIAARKGMLVCVAAGNEGNNEWHTISVPSDADSILTVGAVGYDSIAGGFSSYGPAADGRVKPDVCAVGVSAALINPDGQIYYSNGTSFATPLLAGMAACLWSALPNENAMQIRERIIRSANRYDEPEMGQYGYGIPDAWAALNAKPAAVETIQIEEQPRKIIRGSEILIIRHGYIYNLAGQRVQ